MWVQYLNVFLCLKGVNTFDFHHAYEYMQLLHTQHCLHSRLHILRTNGGLKAMSTRWHVRAKACLSLMFNDILRCDVKQTDKLSAVQWA